MPGKEQSPLSFSPDEDTSANPDAVDDEATPFAQQIPNTVIDITAAHLAQGGGLAIYDTNRYRRGLAAVHVQSNGELWTSAMAQGSPTPWTDDGHAIFKSVGFQVVETIPPVRAVARFSRTDLVHLPFLTVSVFADGASAGLSSGPALITQARGIKAESATFTMQRGVVYHVVASVTADVHAAPWPNGFESVSGRLTEIVLEPQRTGRSPGAPQG